MPKMLNYTSATHNKFPFPVNYEFKISVINTSIALNIICIVYFNIFCSLYSTVAAYELISYKY